MAAKRRSSNFSALKKFRKRSAKSAPLPAPSAPKKSKKPPPPPANLLLRKRAKAKNNKCFRFTRNWLGSHRRGLPRLFFSSDKIKSKMDSAAQTGKPNCNLYIFAVTAFFNDISSEMAYWLVPAFLLTLGAGPATLGLIEGLAEFSASFTKLFSGYLADRLPLRKPIVAGGYAASNIAKPFLAIATRWWHVLLVRFTDRSAKGVRGAARDVMLAESVAPSRLGSAFGFLQTLDSAGAILGPLAALLLLTRVPLRTVFWIAAIPGALAILAVTLGARETHAANANTPRNASPQKSFFDFFRNCGAAQLPAHFYLLLAAVTLFSLGNSSDMFLILRAQSAGIAARFAPLLGLVFNAVYTAASWPAGKLSDKLPKRAVAAAGFVIFAATYFVFASAPSHAALWSAMAGYGMYYALTDPVLRALIAQSIAPQARGRALGIYFFSTSLATLLASLITGALWKRFGPALPLTLSATLALVAAALLLFIRGEQPELISD